MDSEDYVDCSLRPPGRPTLFEEGGFRNLGRDHIGVAVGCGTAILKVALVVLLHLPPDANGSPPVGHAPGELLHGGGLVPASEALLIALAIAADVLDMELLQLLHGRKDGVLEASLSAHGLRRIVEVAPCSVPVAWDGLRFEGTDHRKLLTDPVHQVAGDREMVPGRNALRGAHLVLPLPGHDLCVDAGDLHSGIQARLVVCLHNIAPERIQGPNATVVHPLRGWEPRGGPAQGGSARRT
eukprot:528527_1